MRRGECMCVGGGAERARAAARSCASGRGGSLAGLLRARARPRPAPPAPRRRAARAPGARARPPRVPPRARARGDARAFRGFLPPHTAGRRVPAVAAISPGPSALSPQRAPERERARPKRAPALRRGFACVLMAEWDRPTDPPRTPRALRSGARAISARRNRPGRNHPGPVHPNDRPMRFRHARAGLSCPVVVGPNPNRRATYRHSYRSTQLQKLSIAVQSDGTLFTTVGTVFPDFFPSLSNHGWMGMSFCFFLSAIGVHQN